jgi:hypothetical protein
MRALLLEHSRWLLLLLFRQPLPLLLFQYQ